GPGGPARSASRSTKTAPGTWPAAWAARPSKGAAPAAVAAVRCQRTSSSVGEYGPANSLASSDAEMMAFIAPILAHGLSASPRAGYAAPPDRFRYPVDGVGHMLYSRSTTHRNRMETDMEPDIGHPAAVGCHAAARPRHGVRPVMRASARSVHM